MCAILCAIAGLLALWPAQADGWSRPLLWRVERPQSGPVYLLGTIHLPLSAIGRPPAALSGALAEVRVVVTEIPLDGAAQADLLLRAAQPAGRSLADDLPPELLARLSRTASARGLPPAVLERFRPWAVLGQLATLDWLAEASRSPALDQWLWRRAAGSGLACESLETVGEQVAAFESFSGEQLARLIELSLDQLEGTPTGHRAGEDLLAAFRAGDLDGLMAEFSAELEIAGDLGRKFRSVMLDRRNVRMADRIIGRLSGDRRPQLIAVGALHLAGDGGLLARLRKAGWRLEPVETGPARPARLSPVRAR